MIADDSYWRDKAKTLLKQELSKREMSVHDLTIRLQQSGLEVTGPSVSNKISRGTFGTTFFLQALNVIGCHHLNLTDKLESAQLRELVKEPASLYLSNQLELSFNTNASDSPFIFSDRSGAKAYIDTRYTQPSPRLVDNKVISLFSGAGGFDLGLEAAGFNTVVCVENDPHCRATLRHNRPGWKLFEKTDNRAAGDIRSISAQELLDYADLEHGEAALVIGGAPCQPFSNIGKRQGTNDPTHGDLFLEFVRIVEGTAPQGFIFENVRGITHKRHNAVIEYMTSQFTGLGYQMTWAILDAADYGVPQHRKRFFLIGIRDGSHPALPLPTHAKNLDAWRLFTNKLHRMPPYRPQPWLTVREAFRSLPEDVDKRPDYVRMNISRTVRQRMTFIGPGENFKVLPLDLRPNCWKNGKHQGQDTFGRIRWDRPSNTIRTAAYNPSKGQYIHPQEDRGLHSIEMALLQGFPLSWTFKVAKQKMTLKSAGKQIGNAVPPPLACAIGRAVKIQMYVDTPDTILV